MKYILSIIITLLTLSVTAQVPNITWGKRIWATSQFQLGNDIINSISKDTTGARSDFKLITEKAVKDYVDKKVQSPDSLRDGYGTKVLAAGTKKYKIDLDTTLLKNLLDSIIALRVAEGQYLDSPRIRELIVHLADSLIGEGGGGSSDTTSLEMLMAFNRNSSTGNISLGTNSGANNEDYSDVVSIGTSAGKDNIGEGGVFIGATSGFSNNSIYSIGLGVGAAATNTGDYLIAIGYDAGDANTGDNNILIGRSAGNNNTSNGSIFIGAYTDHAIDSVFENAVAIGNRAFVNKSNSIILGSIAGVNGATDSTYVGIGTTAPGAHLHVVGNTRFEGNGTPGTGKVATGTDGLGNWTWQTPSVGSGVTTMAAIGSSPNANGASISGSTLTLQPASTSFGGVLTAGAQDIAGAKNFTSASTWGGVVTVASANSSDFVFDISRTVTGNDSRHAFGDRTTVNLGRGWAYASYDNVTTFAGDKMFDHHVGYQNRPIISTNDTINTLWGFRDQPTFNTGVSIPNRTGLHVQLPANPVVNPDVNYAVRVDAINAAKGDSNFAFHAAGGRMMMTATPVVTANYGLISLGPGNLFNGSTTGFFAGAANGTYYAANAASGFVGDLMSLQTAGVTRMAVGGGGNVIIGGPYSLSNSRLTIYNSAASTAVQTQYVNGSTGTGGSNGGVVGLNSSNNLEMNMRQAASLEFKTTNVTRMTIGSTGNTTLNGNFTLGTAGNKLSITTGSNASVGTGTFSSGAATISTTAVTANSLIFIQYTSCSNCGTNYISARSAGTSFTVTSTNGSDASTFNYWIIN
jgi:hypothetical protein